MTFWRRNPPSLSQRLIIVMGGAALAAVLIMVAIAHYRERATVLEGQERDYRLFVAALAHAAKRSSRNA